MPRSATIHDLHHASDTKAVLSVRDKLLDNNYLFSVALFPVLLKYFMLFQSSNHSISYSENQLSPFG